MNKLFFIKTFSLIVFIAISSTNCYSQNYLKEIEQVEIGNNTVSIGLPKKSVVFGNINRIKSATLLVQIDLNKEEEEYVIGKNGSNESFDYEFSFSIAAYNSSAVSVGKFEKERYTLKINNSTPVKTLSVNLKYALLNATIEDLDVVQIVDPQLRLITNPTLVNNIRTTAAIEVEYSHGVTFADMQPLSTPLIENPSISGKNATFKWTYPYPFTQYQIQLLKLENKKENIRNDSEIETDIDWSKSIPINITVSDLFDEAGNLIVTNSATITLGEGSGYFAWRIRAIGNYVDGGIANSANWGIWSNTESGEKNLVKNSLTTGYFYFSDPDAGINSMFGRVFTEDNKVKEITTFANGLNQVQQTKTYMPTNDVTLTSQSLTDYSGRSALSTLPMPTPGKNEAYSKNFMTSGGVLYTEKNFSKAQADYADELREMVYYNNNPDPRIPESQGVPFSQTTFYGDPLNRVKEEGAPGRLHMISNGGKTVKYFYGSPSEDELFLIFGPQAPDNKTVSKMVKVDPNNVATITYTSNDGKVIATCISYYNEEFGELEPIDGISTNQIEEINDKITQNSSTEWGFISSKKIIILQNTKLFVEYSISKDKLGDACGSFGISCDYSVDITVYNSETNTVVDKVSAPLMSNEGIYYLDQPLNIPDLAPGSYIIEKRLKLGENATFNDDEAKRILTLQVAPLKDLITYWLDNVKCPDQVDDFQEKLLQLSLDLQNEDFSLDKPYLCDISTEIRTDLVSFLNDIYNSSFGFLNHSNFSLERWKLDEQGVKTIITDNSKTADLIYLITPCCRIPMSVKWLKKPNFYQKPIIKDINNDGWLQPKNTEEYPEDKLEFVPDFEGYALAFFNRGDCKELDGNKFYRHMNGWGGTDADGNNIIDGTIKGTFNLMVYHMLTDNLKPYVKNPFIEEDIEEGKTVTTEPQIYTDECGNVVDVSWHNGVYNTRDLFECWEKQLRNLKERYCGEFELSGSDLDQPVDVLDRADKESDDGATSVNKSINKVVRKVPWWKRRRVARNIKNKVRRASKRAMTPIEGKPGIDPIQINLVKDFLDCAGYSFVKIITPYDPKPIEGDGLPEDYNKKNTSSSTLNYFSLTQEKTNMYFNKPYQTTRYYKGNGDYYYYPLLDWGPKKLLTDGSISNQLLIQRLPNPIYAFKYFIYSQEGQKSYTGIEASTCYDDPNDCYVVDRGKILPNNRGGMKKKPCCIKNNNTDFCYEDTSYPSLVMLNAEPGSPLYLDRTTDPRWVNPFNADNENNGRFRVSSGGKFESKFIVQDWEAGGRLKCPYDHYSWSSGQRYTFWDLLNNFSTLDDDESDENDVVSRTCNDLTVPKMWYHNTDTLFEDLPEFVTQDEYPALFVDDDGVQHILPQYVDYPHLRGDQTVKPNTISAVEWEIAEMRNECFDSCAARKDEIREKVIDAFVRNCFQIGGCPECENVVMEEDIDKIVQKIIGQCNSQCNSLRTFGCYNMSVRSLSHPKKDVGPTETDKGRLLIGVGGLPDQEYSNLDENEVKVYRENEAKTLKKWDFNSDGTHEMIRVDVKGSSEGVEKNFSFYEYTMAKQATEWDFEINFPSMCDNYTIEAENASEFKNAVVSTSGVGPFRNYDPVNPHIAFRNIDFGDISTGTVKLVVRYKVNGTNNLGRAIEVKVGDTRYTIQNNSYSNDFIEHEILLNPSKHGPGDIEIRVITLSLLPTDITIDWIKLVSTPGAYSKIREFAGFKDGEGSTYIRKNEFEKEDIKIEDSNLPKIGDPVISPTKNIKVIIKE